MADISPAPLQPSTLNSLPVELLKRIVELVREQDESFKSCNFPSALQDYEERDSEDEDVDEEDLPDVSNGRWPSFYGRGILALSSMNKRLREMTLPYLFKTASIEKLRKPFFRYGILNTPLCKLITCLNSFEPPESDFLDVAWALPLLPNLTAFTFRYTSSGFPITWNSPNLPGHSSTEMARQAFEKAFGGLMELSLRNFSGHTPNTGPTTSALQLAPSTLRVLNLEDYYSVLSHEATELVAALGRFALESLIIDIQVPFQIHESWRSLSPMHSLCYLKIAVGSLGLELLSFVERIAPNLINLTLTRVSNSTTFNNLEPSTTLTKLAHLRVEGHFSFVRLIRFFSLTPLRTLTIGFNGQCDRYLQKILPPFELFPPSLRRLRCEITSRSRPRDEESTRTSLAAKGISLEVAWTPSDDVFQTKREWREWRADGNASLPAATTLEQEQRRAIREDCKWAGRQADSLFAKGDKWGMQELAEAMRRIREKRILEQQ
ncbi:hypothetical protein JCM11251_007524 [Rhodosporidiobolus azoricus]